MLDCSRNAVFTVEKVKSFIRIMAKLGMNTLMLYTEETYTVPDEPYFGAYRGRYSQDEIREMDAYARTFGIEPVSYTHLVTTFVGQNFGAGKYDRMKKSVRIGLCMGLCTALTLSLIHI